MGSIYGNPFPVPLPTYDYVLYDTLFAAGEPWPARLFRPEERRGAFAPALQGEVQEGGEEMQVML